MFADYLYPLIPLYVSLGIMVTIPLLQLFASACARDKYIYQKKDLTWHRAYECLECEAIMSTVASLDACPYCGCDQNRPVKVLWKGLPAIGFWEFPGKFLVKEIER